MHPPGQRAPEHLRYLRGEAFSPPRRLFRAPDSSDSANAVAFGATAPSIWDCNPGIALFDRRSKRLTPAPGLPLTNPPASRPGLTPRIGAEPFEAHGTALARGCG